MAPVAWESLLFLSVCYVSLITCWSAEDDAVGARLMLRGPRVVIRITQEVIDKAGLNRLLDPHQSPFPLFPFSQHQQCPPHLLPISFRSILGATPWEPSLLRLNAITGVSSASRGVLPWLRIPIPPPSIVGQRLLIRGMICSKMSS
jgi:hypothetical protein